MSASGLINIKESKGSLIGVYRTQKCRFELSDSQILIFMKVEFKSLECCFRIFKI